MRAYCFEIQNFLPTRVTSLSNACIDHMITTHKHKTETLEPTICDRFAATAEIPLKLENCKRTAPVKKTRHFKNPKKEEDLNFIFCLDQQSKNFSDGLNADS